MTVDEALDLSILDRRVARAHAQVERAVAELATEQGRGAARAIGPLDGVREVSTQSTYVGLRGLDLGPEKVPHRDALCRWVHELLQTRVGWELLVDEAEAAVAMDPQLGPRARAEAPVARSFDEAFQALVEAAEVTPAEIALRRLEELAAPVAAVRKELRARRFEAARRLGLAHPWALAGDAGAFAEVARSVLDATEPLALELYKQLRRRTGELSPARAIHDGFARDATEGWPARLGARWLEDVFRVLAPHPPRAVRLPRALGGASFLRAAAAWGHALRLGGTARSLPFAIARDPYPAEAFAFGCAFAAAVADRVFAKRKLGLPARLADAHARATGRVLFTTLRRTAAAVLAGMRDAAPADEIEELGARVFGAPLPAPLGALWSYGGLAPLSGRAEAIAALPARLVGAVRAHELVRGWVERFDEDWFDNPRAATHLAGIAAGPVGLLDVPRPDAVAPIARAFEELLG
jgi:hypothetical protein